MNTRRLALNAENKIGERRKQPGKRKNASKEELGRITRRVVKTMYLPG